jgi:hypothetical protein
MVSTLSICTWFVRGDLEAATVTGHGKPVAVVVDRDGVDAVDLHPIAVVGDSEAGAVAADGKRVVVAGQRRLAVAACGVGDRVVVAGYLDGVGAFDVDVIIEAGHREAGTVTGDVNHAVDCR